MRFNRLRADHNISSPYAFTLIEVLVVVAIIALLMAILLPSLKRAREQAHNTRCKAQVRQLGTGMTMYLHQFDVYPSHQWRLKPTATNNDPRLRWFDAMADQLRMRNTNDDPNGGMGKYEIRRCPSTPDWEIGRNNSYGYNYKYLGSARYNLHSPRPPYENFPVKQIGAPDRTIAFGDTDGTGWKDAHENGTKGPDMFGNHGYTLDPTYLPLHSEHTYNKDPADGGHLEAYAWHEYRTYMSTRHLGGSNFCFADGHVEWMTPKEVYTDNRYWNGLGGEDFTGTLDPHVDFKIDAGIECRPGFEIICDFPGTFTAGT